VSWAMSWPTSWAERQLVCHAIGSATGLVLAVVFLLLLSRAPRQSTGLRTLALLIACGIGWNLGMLGIALLTLAGPAPYRSLICHASALANVSASLLPIALVVVWRPRLGLRSGSWLCSSWFLGATVVISVCLAVTCLIAIYFPNSGIEAWTPRDWTAYHIAFTAVAGAVALLHGTARSPSLVFYALTTAGGACIMAFDMLLYRWLPPSPETYFWLGLAKQDAGLLMVLGCFFLFGTFRFAHVFVKQSLRILAIAGGAPLLWALLSTLPSTGARGFLIASGLLSAVLLLAPLLDRSIGLSVDRWLLRRPDYAGIARRTWDAMNPLDSEPEILRTVANAVTSTLALEHCAILPASEVSEVCGVSLREGEIHETCRYQPSSRMIAGREVHVLVAVRTGGSVRYAMALTQHSRHADLLSAEVRFLLTMASQLGSRLEALQFEGERIERQNREARLHSEIVQAQLKALRAQINPHFLFNSLNAIADLIVANPELAEGMTLRLARVFRYVLTNSERQLAPVAEEMEFLRSYLGIEEARFGGRLRVSFNVEQGVNLEPIPSLLLQPLVENAIKHGLAPKVGEGHLSISATREGAYLKLEVEDDGMGPQRFKRVSTGLGLRNVADRLKTLYQGRANMHFEGEPMRGSRVTILIPCAG
jgi:two-component system, LytTR family, sensor kinase